MRFNLRFLFFITVLAAILRLVFLGSMPPSPNWDEISHGYNAYSLLKTGTDEWGKIPIANFRAYGDYPLPLNLYITIPSIVIFGLTTFAIRFPHALLGIGSVLLTYFLAYGITKKRDISLLASLLLAISPWAVFTSRFVLQANVAVFFLIAGVTAFLYREKSRLLLPVSVVCLGLTLFSYHSTRIFTPLFVFAIIFVYKNEIVKLIKLKVNKLLTIGLVLLFFAPLPFILLNPEARARSGVVFLLDQGAINSIEQSRATSNLSPVVNRIVNNKVTYFATHTVANYGAYFTSKFLFLEGGTQYQFSVPHQGLLYLVELPFFYIGLILLFVNTIKRRKQYILVSMWLLLAPIPASITQDSYAVVRAMTMLPVPQLLSAIGFFAIINYFKKYKKISIALYLVALALCMEQYLTNYFTSYKINYSWAWQWGYKDAVDFANANYTKYQKIIVTKKYGEPHEYFLFFLQWDPRRYKTDPNLIRFTKSQWWWVDRFDKFYFVNDWQIPKEGSNFVLESGNGFECWGGCLLITSPGNAPHGWNKIKTVNFLDGKPAFEFYED